MGTASQNEGLNAERTGHGLTSRSMHTFGGLGRARALRFVMWLLTPLILAGLTLTSLPMASSSATVLSVMSPAIVARAGSSDVLYVLWESTSCHLQRCLRLERSVNGGQTFSRVAVPPVTRVFGGNTSPISNLYFANPLDGYAEEFASTGSKWSTTTLFVTSNGGQSWRRQEIAPRSVISSMASSARFFYAMTEQCPAKGRCSHQLLSRSKVGTVRWTQLALPKQMLKYWSSVEFAAYGRKVWLTAQNQVSKPFSPFLATSLNSGESFTVAVQPELSSVNSCGVLPISSDVLWAACDQGNMHGDVVYSSDGGARWQFNQKSPLGQFYFGVFEPVSKSSAYFINGMYPQTLFRVRSEAATPIAVAKMPNKLNWMSLDLTNGRQGVALSESSGGGFPYILWRTDNGGSHWSRVTL